MSLAEKEGTVEQEVFIGNLFSRFVFCFLFLVLVYFNKSFFLQQERGRRDLSAGELPEVSFPRQCHRLPICFLTF